MKALSNTGRAGLARRVWEWIWRTGAVSSARARRAEQTYLRACRQRGRIALEVGERTLDPSTPFSAGSASYLAAGLFAEAIGWSLRATENAHRPRETVDLRPPDEAELGNLTRARQDLMLEAAGDPEISSRVLQSLLERRFETGNASELETEQAARELGKVARALERATAPHEDDLDTLYYQRLVRAGTGVLLLVTLIAGSFGLREALEKRNDLSVGKPWRASSSYEVVCRSPERRCAGQKSYFFHTVEETSPWLEIDLQKERTFSRLRAFNRQDCCAERAVPLVVEVSSDRHHWREVARKTEVFDQWQARFAPVTAHFVRLRVDGRASLHLADVRVLE